MKKDEVSGGGGTCGTYRRKERCIHDLSGENWRKETTLETWAQVEE